MEIRDINTLYNWDRNPRNIKTEEFERLKKNLLMGQHTPLLIRPDGKVLGGNMRLQAMRELNYTEVDCLVADFQLEEGKGYFVILNGKTYRDKDGNIPKYFATIEQGEVELAFSHNMRAGVYVEDMVADLVGNFADIDWSLYDADFKDPVNLDEFQKNLTAPLEDDVPPLEETAISVPGEIYQLGRHRLMCGDSSNKTQVDLLLQGITANVLITDPPYGVDYGAKNEFLNNQDKGNRVQKDIQNDHIEDYEKFFTEFLINLKDKFDNTFYIFISGKEMHNLIRAIHNCGYKYSQDIIWVKNNHVLGRMDYNSKHENILYGWQNTHKFFGGHQTSIIEYDKPLVSDLHPTMKPVGLITKLIKDSSLENNIILDVFGGSGTTLIAAEQTNRTCFMMELDPRYVDVIRKRYAKLIGKETEWQTSTPKI